MQQLKEILCNHFPDNGNFDVEDYVHAYGDPRQALLLFRVFWPEFTIVAGNIVLKSRIDAEGGPDKLLSLLENEQDREKVLSGYRWVEVPYLFGDRLSLSEVEDRYLAKLIAEVWKGALCSQFPEQQFHVQVLPPSVTGSVVGVGFNEQADA